MSNEQTIMIAIGQNAAKIFVTNEPNLAKNLAKYAKCHISGKICICIYIYIICLKTLEILYTEMPLKH